VPGPFVPDGAAPEDAFSRTTHLAIGAHPDDLEVMAYHGVAECFDSSEKWFGGVVVCDGAGSPRSDSAAVPEGESPREGGAVPEGELEMAAARRKEQERAAEVGKYSFALLLGMASSKVKGEWNPALVVRLAEILDSTKFDRHATHLAVFAHALRAIRSLPEESRPARVLGCEVWRDLDWLGDKDRVRLDCSSDPKLARELLDVFGSQIQGGKNYTEATLGRRRANATFSDSHEVDRAESLAYAVDLMPLVNDPKLSLKAFCEERLEGFKREALAAVEPWGKD
jgi:LmbE family N-acetylglucosaminyl deacetylase